MVQEADERAIADILAQYTHIAESILDVDGRLVLARQEHVLPNGRRSDLVYLAGDSLVVVELKVNEATIENAVQIADYADIYERDIIPKEFPGSSLKPVLLAPSIPQKVADKCRGSSIEPVEFDIERVLDQFSNTAYADFDRFMLEGAVTGVSSLHLINGIIQYIGNQKQDVSVSELSENYDSIGHGEIPDEDNRRVRVNRFLRIGRQLDLLTESEHTLTDRGEQYYEAITSENLWSVTNQQADAVTDLLYNQPFYSDLTFSIVALLETLFELSKNSRPVVRRDILDWYTGIVGKRGVWEADRTITPVVRWTGNYAEELGLIRRVGRGDTQTHYITPEGFKLLASVQIQKGHEMVRSLGFFNRISVE